MGSVKYHSDLHVAIMLGTSLKYRKNMVMEQDRSRMCVHLADLPQASVSYVNVHVLMSVFNCLTPILFRTQAKTVETAFEVLKPKSMRIGRSGESALLVGYSQRVLES